MEEGPRAAAPREGLALRRDRKTSGHHFIDQQKWNVLECISHGNTLLKFHFSSWTVPVGGLQSADRFWWSIAIGQSWAARASHKTRSSKMPSTPGFVAQVQTAFSCEEITNGSISQNAPVHLGRRGSSKAAMRRVLVGRRPMLRHGKGFSNKVPVGQAMRRFAAPPCTP